MQFRFLQAYRQFALKNRNRGWNGPLFLNRFFSRQGRFQIDWPWKPMRDKRRFQRNHRQAVFQGRGYVWSYFDSGQGIHEGMNLSEKSNGLSLSIRTSMK